MSKIDYNKIREITVVTQEELDAIPVEYVGRIYITFGTYFDKAIVKNRKNVVARGNASVVAWENASVEAWENASVVARENASVVANANVQVIKRSSSAKISIGGNARIVYMPKTIHEFMDFYGIAHNKTTAKFFKAVHKSDNVYFSDYNNSFKYSIGSDVSEKCDKDTSETCSYGIHISHRDWALKFGESWSDMAILEMEVKIKDVVLPEQTDGKVRTNKAKVLREVPLEECGLYGKMIAKRRANK